MKNLPPPTSSALRPIDAAWLDLDTPSNLMVITGMIFLSEQITLAEIEEVLHRELINKYPRFTQRVAGLAKPFIPRRWVTDSAFTLKNHIRTVEIPDRQDSLREYVSNLLSEPLDMERPPWLIHVVKHGDDSTLVVRIHHAIADGIALIRVLLSLTDVDNESLPRPRKNKSKRLIDSAKFVAKTVPALYKFLLSKHDPATSMKGHLGVAKTADWSHPLDLEQVKELGGDMGATVNDVLLSLVAGALRRYLLEQGRDPEDLRAAVPVNLRPLDGAIEMGNKFGIVLLALPVGEGDALERLQSLKVRMDQIKRSPEAIVAYALLTIMGIMPRKVEQRFMAHFGARATAVMTNVPGPQSAIQLGNIPVDGLMFWVPSSGGVSLGISIISYNGQVTLGIAADVGLVPDSRMLIQYFHEEFLVLQEQVNAQK